MKSKKSFLLYLMLILVLIVSTTSACSSNSQKGNLINPSISSTVASHKEQAQTTQATTVQINPDFSFESAPTVR